MDDPAKALLRRWLKDSEIDEQNDCDPLTVGLVAETKIFLGIDVEESRAVLLELLRVDGE